MGTEAVRSRRKRVVLPMPPEVKSSLSVNMRLIRRGEGPRRGGRLGLGRGKAGCWGKGAGKREGEIRGVVVSLDFGSDSELDSGRAVPVSVEERDETTAPQAAESRRVTVPPRGFIVEESCAELRKAPNAT